MNIIELPEKGIEKKVVLVALNLLATEIVLYQYLHQYGDTKNITIITANIEARMNIDGVYDEFCTQIEEICRKFNVTEKLRMDSLEDFNLPNLDNPFIDSNRIDTFDSLYTIIANHKHIDVNHITSVIFTIDKLWFDCYHLYSIAESIQDFENYINTHCLAYVEFLRRVEKPSTLSFFKSYTENKEFSFLAIKKLLNQPDFFYFPFRDMSGYELARLNYLIKNENIYT